MGNEAVRLPLNFFFLSRPPGRNSGFPVGPETVRLFPESEFLNQSPIPLDALALQVIEVFSPLSHHLQKTPSGMVVLSVGFQMLGEFPDPFAQESHLDFGGTGIQIVIFKTLDNIGFSFLEKGQSDSPPFVSPDIETGEPSVHKVQAP